ncbi:MAG TPA: hypothetical protein PKD55_04575 [Bellilinea sp.]|nr:hypothetical protein [Bellilinea sp.]
MDILLTLAIALFLFIAVTFFQMRFMLTQKPWIGLLAGLALLVVVWLVSLFGIIQVQQPCNPNESCYFVRYGLWIAGLSMIILTAVTSLSGLVMYYIFRAKRWPKGELVSTEGKVAYFLLLCAVPIAVTLSYLIFTAVKIN